MVFWYSQLLFKQRKFLRIDKIVCSHLIDAHTARYTGTVKAGSIFSGPPHAGEQRLNCPPEDAVYFQRHQTADRTDRNLRSCFSRRGEESKNTSDLLYAASLGIFLSVDPTRWTAR